MKKVNINLQWEKEKIHTVMAEELDFPSYYGKNLDDTTAVSGVDAEDTVISDDSEKSDI